MESIDEIWRQIEFGLSQTFLTDALQLPPGAAEEDIAQLESVIGIALPEDFRASYRRHNAGFTLEPVVFANTLPTKSIAEHWLVLEELLHDKEWAEQPPYYFSEDVVRDGWQTGPIQPVWWHRHWIPFAADYGGNLTCLDMAPAPGGTLGQIIDWDHECGPTCVLYPDFTHLLTALAEEREKPS